MLTIQHRNGYWVAGYIQGKLITRLYIGVNKARAIELFNQEKKGE